jgi:hypothetical protein
MIWVADCHGRRPRRRTSAASLLGVVLLIGSLIACNGLLGDVQIERGTLMPAPVQSSMTGTADQDASAGDACEPGAVRCTGAALQLCSPEARWFTTTICGSAALCGTDPPACRVPACALDELRCDGAVLEACNVDRDGWLELDTCASPALCSPRVRNCLPEPCSVGELACNDRDLARCGDDEVGWIGLDSCETPALCEAARSDGSSRCVAPACEAGARRCLAGNLLACNEGRTDWELLESCASPDLCELTLARESVSCESPRCALSEHRCEGATLTVCNAARDDFDVVQVCASATLCDALSGSCGVAACEPGERRCNGAQIEVCDESATGFVPDVERECATPELCTSGPDGDVFCAEPVCEPGQSRCNGAALELCDGARTGFLQAERCASEALCIEFGTEARCEPPACDEGEAECQSARVLAVCNADRTRFDTTQCGLLGCDARQSPARCRTLLDVFN